MRKQAGFTLIELMVVIAIVGILSATAVPLYRTFQQRTYGREAVVMVKQILDAQVIYFLAHDKFYPENDAPIYIFDNSSPDAEEIQVVKNALNVHIPVGHKLDFYFGAQNTPGDEIFTINISSAGEFPLFKGGAPNILGSVDRTGKFTFIIPD